MCQTLRQKESPFFPHVTRKVPFGKSKNGENLVSWASLEDGNRQCGVFCLGEPVVHPVNVTLHCVGDWITSICHGSAFLKRSVDPWRSQGSKMKGHPKFMPWSVFIFYPAKDIQAPCWASLVCYFQRKDCLWQSQTLTSRNTDGKDYSTLCIDL